VKGIEPIPPSQPPPRRRRPWWLRLLLLALILGGSGILLITGLVIAVAILWQKPAFQTWVFRMSIEHQSARIEPPAPAAVPTDGVPYADPGWKAAEAATPDQLFRPERIWTAHLEFGADGWRDLGPRRVPTLPDWRRPDGTLQLRNPAAIRPGVAGVFGFDLPWSRGDFEFGGVRFTNAAIRFKGNGTFLDSLGSYRRPFKVDVAKKAKGRHLAGLATLNLHNLTADRSCLSDTLAYEFYRDAGVPAPHTTFVRLFLTVGGRFERRPLGIYLLVENPDADWTRRTFGTEGVALFKPSTPEFLADLGDAWVPYHEIYDPKTRTTPAQRSRLVELARLVTHADEAEFARRIADLVDLDNAARFLACEALMANFDGLLCNGQNFLLWLDPRSNRFGFGPWDLDHSWGEFGWIGSARDRERAALFHPWVGPNRFLERLFAVDEFRTRYRAELIRLLDTLFVPDRLNRRIDELAAVLRPALAEEAGRRRENFERAVAEPGPDDGAEPPKGGDGRPTHRLKRFISARSTEARAQLEGRSEGVRPERRGL
jgi:spore coat protein H